jgi:hypothetical protein
LINAGRICTDADSLPVEQARRLRSMGTPSGDQRSAIFVDPRIASVSAWMTGMDGAQ